MNFNTLLKNLARYFLTTLSIFYTNDLTKYKNRSEKTRKQVQKFILRNKLISNVTNTHLLFNNKIFKVLSSSSKLLSFLSFPFIQQMFFVHNRFFIFKELNELKKSSLFKILYKKLLIEDDLGNPIRYFLYPKSSGNRINHVYHLSLLTKYLNVDLLKISHVFEFGGGYGCMARIFFKINKNINYVIYDTFYVNLLQYYYLKTLGQKPFLSFKKNQKLLLINNISQLNKINKKKSINSLFIANWSLSETPIKFRLNFKRNILNSKYIIISFQELFEDIENLKYFLDLKKELNNKYYVKIIKNKFYKGSFLKRENHYYFLAKKK